MKNEMFHQYEEELMEFLVLGAQREDISVFSFFLFFLVSSKKHTPFTYFIKFVSTSQETGTLLEMDLTVLNLFFFIIYILFSEFIFF